MAFALSAPEALELIGRALEATLILILSDINMPGMSGLQLLPKAREARPGVPVIMITGQRRPSMSSSWLRRSWSTE